MGARKTIRGRYEIKAIIGRGGMGVVYRAYDPVMKREVAVKTLHDISSQPVLDLFYRECAILKGIVHPNVIDILDMGDFEDEGVTKPYYVMPLLPGKTLYDLLHPSKDVTEPLTVDRAVEIIVQTSRGLHAAHERELLHRDVKPRNIFVIDEYSVKLIDFGVAHLLGSNSTTGVKGTLEYMSPEQLKMKPLSRRTDIFSLATVCYEILTGIQPFRCTTEAETAAAVVNTHPVLACDVNHSVPKAISQVISKGMAKEPLSRFATVAEFAEALQRARRNEPLTDLFDPTESRVRLQRAQHSFEQGDYQFASEVLRDLESEGQAYGEIQALRRRVDEALQRQATASLYESAKRYFDTEEYSLALRKAQEILELDGAHAGAIALKKKIEDALAERRVAEMLHSAAERLEHAAFTEARKTLQDAQRLRPDDSRVRQLLSEVDSRQKEFFKQRQEQERLYQSSQAAWVQRDISLALTNLERLAELVKKTPEPQDRIIEYRDFHKVVRTEHDALLAALGQAKQAFAAGDLGAALALCAEYLGKYPRHEGFAILKSEIEQRREEQQIAYRADIDRRLGSQPNLEAQVQILEEAQASYPQDTSYSDQLRRVRELQAEVASALEAAQVAEDADDFDAALTHWARVRTSYPQYPGLDEQVSRVTKARVQAQAAAKSRWARDIERALDRGDLEQAASLLTQAGEEFPGEFTQLQQRHDQAHQRRAEARRLLSEANSLASAGRPAEAIEMFRKSYEMIRGATSFKRSVIEAMVGHAQGSVEQDWRVAEQYLQGALALDPAFSDPKEIRVRINERQQVEFVTGVLSRAADFEGKGEFQSALSEIDSGLARYPAAKQLREMRTAVEAALKELELKRAQEEALRRVRELAHRAEGNLRDQDVQRLREEVLALTQRYPGNSELNQIGAEIGQQLLDLHAARAKVAGDDLEGARALAARYLARSPGHVGFLDIQAQVSERELQLAIEYMDEVNKQLLAETGLDQRVQVLQEALRRYPDETHYREQLDLVLAKQNLVRSIVEEAAALEKAGRYKEALDQWQRLSAIHSDYPDLQASIARVSQLQEQVLREAEEHWIAQIGKALNGWDFVQALDLVRKAQVDFPGRFRDLEDRAKQGADRRAGARRLIAEARESSRKERWEESQGKLREARALAPGDPAIENQIAGEYAKTARVALKSDWKIASTFLQEAATLDTSFVPPADLTAKIEEKQQSEFVEQALTESKQRRESEGLQAALEVIQAALSRYPTEARLTRERDSLDLELRKITEEQERRRALEELWQMDDVTRTMVTSPLELDRILNRAQDIARNHPKDSELNSFSETLREQVEALQRARELLEAGQTDESESITDRMLERFEKHSAFQALKQAIQDARTQAAADYMDEITRRLREEHDLSRGEALLLEAVEKYPSEQYYQQELEFLREKQRMVAGIVTEARAAEQAGRLDETLDLWKKLQTVHRHYAGLDAEMTRITAVLAEKQSSARRELLAEAGNAIQEHDFPQAARLLRRIESEFGKPAADDCARLQARMDATVAALQLEEEGRSLFKDGKDAEGSVKFIAAARKVPEDRKFVDALIEELIQRTTAIVGADWRKASALVQAIHDIDAKQPALSSLRARIADSKREEAVAGFLKEAQALLQKGDPHSAEKAIVAALGTYPGDARLTECLTEVRALLAEESRRRQRDQALKELAGLENEAQTANPKRLKRALKEADLIAAKAGSDPEVQARASAVKKSLTERITDKAQRGSPEKPGPLPAQAPADSKRKLVWLGAGIAAAAVGAFLIARGLFSSHDVPVTITSQVAGASVTVGAKTCVTPNCAMNLPAGNYTLTAKKDGYKTVAQNFTISSQQAPVTLPLTLDPLPQELEVNTNFESGRVLIDGRPAGDLRDGRFVLPALAPGQHTVRVTDGQADFQAAWRSSAGERPAVVSPITAKDLDATVVTSMGEDTTVTCNCGVQDVMVDGVQSGRTADAPGTAVPLKNLKEGSHEISIGGRSLVVDTRLNPSVRLFLALDRNVGTIVVETGVEDATIYLNKRAYKTNAQGGVLRLPVDVGRYSIRAEKDGYKYSGQPPRPVDIRKGEEMRVSALLSVELPMLEIVGALPGAQVRLDGAAAGETDANGSFRRQVQVGEHTIEIVKDEYTPARFALQFSPGKTVRPDRGQLTMARVVRPPPAPDPVQIEAQDWERIRASNNISDFDDFLRRHATGAHAGDARNRADQLRQQQAKQADQAAWDATDKTRKPSLQDYLRRFPNGAHVQEANGLISGIDKQTQAAAEKQAADKLAADKAAADKAAADKAAQAKEQEAKNRAALDIQAINATIKAYETAYNDMKLADLQKIWPSMPKNTRDNTSIQFRDARTVTYKLTPSGPPVITGNSATANCEHTLNATFKNGQRSDVSDRVTVILDRSGTGWLIRSIN